MSGSGKKRARANSSASQQATAAPEPGEVAGEVGGTGLTEPELADIDWLLRASGQLEPSRVADLDTSLIRSAASSQPIKSN